MSVFSQMFRRRNPPRSVQPMVVEEKVNPAYAGIVLFGSGMNNVPQPHMMPKNYRNYAIEGYRGNMTLFKCINYIITNGAAIPPVLYTDETKQKRIDNHLLLDKLKRPNVEQSGVAYRKAVLGYYLVAGNSYQYAIRKGVQGPPDELWTLQPDKVKVNPTATRGVVSYLFDDFQGTVEHPVAGQNPIPAVNIAHLKTWSPDDPLFGVSPIEVGAIAVDQVSVAQKWNLALLQNWARLPGAFTTNIIMDPNTRSKTEDKINEKMAGARNAGKIPLLDGGLQWVQMGAPPAQMDWLPGMQYLGGALANLYNMPPQLVGDTSSTTYNNMQEAKAASYTEEIFPILDDLYAMWNMWLVPMYPDLCDATGKPLAYLYYDKESVEVVQAVIQAQKDAKAKRAFQAWAAGSVSSCTLNEAREMQGLPPDPQGDVYRFGQVIVQKGALDKYAEQSLQKPAALPQPVPEPSLNQPAPGQPPLQGDDGKEPINDDGQSDADDYGDGNSDSSKSRSSTDHQGHSGVSPSRKSDEEDESRERRRRAIKKELRFLATRQYFSQRRSTKALDLTTEAERKAYHDQVESQRHTWEKEVSGRLQGYFKSEQQAVVQALRHATPTATDEDHLLNQAKAAIDSHKSKLQHVIANIWRDVAEDFAKSTEQAFAKVLHKSVQRKYGNEFFSSQIIAYLMSLAGQKVTGIDQTTLDMLQIALANGVEGGESLQQLAKRIDQLYLDEIIPNRSLTIAATEVVGASNYGSIQYAKQSGLTLNKIWQSTGDGHTRPAHADADGQSVPMDTPFDVDGESLDYPGDPSGSANNIINCRCAMRYQRVASTAPDDTSSDDNSDDDEEEKRHRRMEYKRFMEVLV